MVSHSKMKTFTLPSTSLTLSFCAEPKAKSQNPSSNKQPCLQNNSPVRPQCKMKVLPVQDFLEPNNATSHLHPNLWTETILRFFFCAEGLRLEECSNS